MSGNLNLETQFINSIDREPSLRVGKDIVVQCNSYMVEMRLMVEIYTLRHVDR